VNLRGDYTFCFPLKAVIPTYQPLYLLAGFSKKSFQDVGVRNDEAQISDLRLIFYITARNT
jgi:hypothetical protein